MSHPSTLPHHPTPPETERYVKTIRYVAIGTCVACPIIALLPPRKLDIFTIGLIGTTAYSANYLYRERTGRAIWQRITEPAEAAESSAISSTEQANLSRELQNARQEMQRLRSDAPSVTEELKATQSQREAWKLQRQQEIQDNLDVGKTFWEMMTDQVWEVWNGAKKEDDDD